MKPWVLRKLEELIEKTKFIRTNGGGNLVLADNGTYISAGGGSSVNIIEHIATSNNQIFSITPQGGTIYAINSSSYTGIKVAIPSATIGMCISIKNTNTTKPITITTAIDGQQNIQLQPGNSLSCVYSGIRWLAVWDYLISYQEKRDLFNKLTALEAGSSYVSCESKTASFTVTQEDNAKFFNCTGSYTIYLPNSSTIPVGLNFYIKNNGTGVIQVSCAISTQNIDNINTKQVTPNECIHIINEGNNYVSSQTSSWIST